MGRVPELAELQQGVSSIPELAKSVSSFYVFSAVK
jgi:hypothetical protein